MFNSYESKPDVCWHKCYWCRDEYQFAAHLSEVRKVHKATQKWKYVKGMVSFNNIYVLGRLSHYVSHKPAGMSSSLVMTTLLVGMSWPWVAALAMGEADMSGKRGWWHTDWGTYCSLRSYASSGPPSTPVVPLRLNCCIHVFLYLFFCNSRAKETDMQ